MFSKGSPEVELWYCWTLNRAAEVEHWPRKASWKSWPAMIQEMACSSAPSPQWGAVSRTVRGRFWLTVSREHSGSEISGDCLVAGLSVENLQELLHHCPLRAYLSYAPPPLCSLKSWRWRLFSLSALLHQTWRSVDSWSHTHKTQQTTSEEPPQSLKDNFFILTSLFLI